MTRYAVAGATRTAREWAAHWLAVRAAQLIRPAVIDWNADPPELVFTPDLTPDETAVLQSLPTAASTATVPLVGVNPTGATGGVHLDLSGHDQLGLATQAEVDAHAGTAHGLASHAIDGAYHSGSEVLPTQGQRNALAGTQGTPGSVNQYVTTQDARLADARTPLAHVHPAVYAVLANGATAMAFGTNHVVKVTPTANATYTTTVPAAGTRVVLLILTTGTVSRTITFGAGFKPTGTLATGIVSARVFALEWTSDGSNLYETGRTAAMVA